MREILTGTGWYSNLPKADEDKVTEAIICETGIDIEYEYHNSKLQIKLKKEDDARFIGHYEEHGEKRGDCEFTLYENKEEYFLYGGYSSPKDDKGTWCIKLLKHK